MFKPSTLLILQTIACLLTIIVMGLQIKDFYDRRKQLNI
jgi:hypothetical protein